MEKPLKIETGPIYIYSMLTVFISIVLSGLVSAFTMKYIWNLNLNTTGCWITCLSILLFGLTSWTNPDSISGWGKRKTLCSPHTNTNNILSGNNPTD
jgi:hypothetical protein